MVLSLLLTPGASFISPVQASSRPLANALPQPAQQEAPVVVAPTTNTSNNGGLIIELAEGAAQPQPSEALPLAEGQPLEGSAIQPILDRLPPLEGDAGDQVDFRLPAATLIRPQAGAVISTTFPPAVDEPLPEAPVAGPLQVLRYAPEGELRAVPFVNVTFSQPMVPLGTLEQLAADAAPVKITPELPGVWKWLGTQTLSFEAKVDELNRFPMATEYAVEIPAGTTSATGGVLEEAVTFRFSTPAATVESSYPNGGSHARDVMMLVRFNQQVDPLAVIETIQVLAGGNIVLVRLASEDEINADPVIANLVKNSQPRRTVVFKAEELFPADTTITVNVGPGTPSAEGPVVTSEVQSFAFQTYAPLRITDQYCGYGDYCPPGSSFSISFNNQLDGKAFKPEWVSVEPAIPDMVVSYNYASLSINGLSAGRTTYKVTVAAEVQDIFGQQLEQSQTLEFRTGSRDAFFSGPSNDFVTLDPSAAPVFPIYSVNYSQLRVRAYRVTPQDWGEFQRFKSEYYYDDSVKMPGEEVMNQILNIDAQPDIITETSLELTELLGGKPGHLAIVVDNAPNIISLFTGNDERKVVKWVQVTAMGLDAVVDNSRMIAWANNLVDGAPLEDVALTLLGPDLQTTTGADGLAEFELSGTPATLLVGSRGDDSAILPYNIYYYYEGDGWTLRGEEPYASWFVFDDRALYRPGETISVKGFVRILEPGPAGDVTMGDLAGKNVSYQIFDPQYNIIGEGSTLVSVQGGFDLTATLPAGANLGYASITFALNGSRLAANSTYYHSFQIQEFRRPEFSVSARNESVGPYFVGDEAVVAAEATYYAGGPLPSAETFWNVSATPTSYSPPNWSEFTFGTWTPWWRQPYYDDGIYAPEIFMSFPDDGSMGEGAQVFGSRTDPTGNHYLRMKFLTADEPRPYSVAADASISDVNRQTMAGSTSLLVHPSGLYVGIRNDSIFVDPGQEMVYELIVTDVDGNAVAGSAVAVTMVRLTSVFEDGRWAEAEVDAQSCTVTSTLEPVSCIFVPEKGGEYRIRAEVRDDRERLNRSEVTRYVSGSQGVPQRSVAVQEALLIPDRESYQPGDVAKVFVQSPFSPAEGLLIVNHNGIIENRRFTITDGSTTLEVPIEESSIPGLELQVTLNGASPRLNDQGQVVEGLPAQPAYATGSAALAVPPLLRTLTVVAVPAAEALAPGAETTLDLTVTDAAGAPVSGAELAVVVVDESVLALTGYQLADPLGVFYTARNPGVNSYYSRQYLQLANTQEMLAQLPMAGGVGGGGGEGDMAFATAAPAAMAPMDGAVMEEAAAAEAPAPVMRDLANAQAQPGTDIAVRTNFDALALFAPEVTTDANGQATVNYTLPDNLTRYRIMVVAAEGNRFGSAEKNITARLPLMVRPSAPRFLNFGDRFELPVVIQNQTDEPLIVDVVVNAANLDLPSAQGLRIEVPANDRREVRFPAGAASAGTARIRFAAVSGDYADSAQVALPVYTPATTEAFATYGALDEGSMIQPLLTPTGVFTQFGGLEISTSSTAVGSLTDALIYLQSYPFECSEQLASRILSVVALRDVLTAFQSPQLPSADAMNAAVARDIARLGSIQNFDGGFAYWRAGDESVPYNSVYVAHTLVMARNKGYEVPEEMLSRSLEYLRNIESYYPSWYSPAVKHTLSSYAVFVRMLQNDVDGGKAAQLFAQYPIDDQSLEALAWLWQVLAQDPARSEQVGVIATHFSNRVVETAGMANFITSYDDQAYLMLHSNRRTDAIILDALMALTPESDLIPKVVRGLMAARNREGYWGNTQENTFVLLAMDRYFNTFEGVEPNFIARIWLGETFLAEFPFAGRSTESQETTVPMAFLTGSNQPQQDLLLAKEGDGRLYYRLGLRYAPLDLQQDALDMGFVVQRSYEAVDQAADVQRGENGEWIIAAGARVRVRVTMVAVTRRYHVALVDPLPAGFEIINPALNGTESVPSDPANPSRGGYWWWWGPWYQHQNLRDQRAEAFTTYLWDGVYTYSYVARATTPGEFVVPPAKAEEMYSPEVFGRSASDRVVIR
jgi:uncharacterized protein YfaS (alpha-2-macroglobulin family)